MLNSEISAAPLVHRREIRPSQERKTFATVTRLFCSLRHGTAPQGTIDQEGTLKIWSVDKKEFQAKRATFGSLVKNPGRMTSICFLGDITVVGSESGNVSYLPSPPKLLAKLEADGRKLKCMY